MEYNGGRALNAKEDSLVSQTQSHTLFVVLCAIFVTALVLADIVGGKLIAVPALSVFGLALPAMVVSAGIIPFPVTFVLTDIINEFYGQSGARFVTFLGLGMAILAALLLYVTRVLPAAPHSPISGPMFQAVFGLSGRLFLGSLVAYLVGQMLDIQVFGFLRKIAKERYLWLRATGSTVVSQLVDSFIVLFITFAGKLSTAEIVQVGLSNYAIKFVVAIALTPVCYLAHSLVSRLLKTNLHASQQA